MFRQRHVMGVPFHCRDTSMSFLHGTGIVVLYGNSFHRRSSFTMSRLMAPPLFRELSRRLWQGLL